MTHIAAAILAGGKAERLGGVNKALLNIGGTRMIDRIVASLAGCDPILLCAGATNFPSDVPAIAVPDLDSDYAGPLVGVAAAVVYLSKSPPDLLLTIAGDTPFFPADFVERALAGLGSASAIIATCDGQDYPTNGLWRFGALKRLPAALRGGTAPHSLKRLADGLGALRLDYSGQPGGNPFANANTPEDLALLRARAAAPLQ